MRFQLTLTAALMLASSAAAQEQHAHWTYEGPDGPAEWGRLDPTYGVCATGQQESPIDLTGAITADLGAVMPDRPAMPMRVFDTGHAIQAEAAPGRRLTMGGKTYELRQFHVHQPSEHLLNGRRFPLEIHFVHAGPDGTLGVLGVFVEAGAANAALQTVIEAVATPEARPMLDPETLLPAGRDFFRYEGSLTTPPCSETVDWAVLADPITASAAQLEAVAGFYSGNARPVQPLHRRFLLRSGH